MPSYKFLTLAICSLLLPTTATLDAQELDSLKSVTEQWIQTRNRISKEQVQWREEKSLLESSIQTLRSTRDRLNDNLSARVSQTRKLETETQNAEDKLHRFDLANELTKTQIPEFEKRIRKIATYLPDPLLEKINPLLRKIPPDGESAVPSPSRLQNIVAIATLIDEFNNNLTLTHTIRELNNGATSEVRVLYWGLAGAYASSSDGMRSWILHPEAGGWKWTEATEANEAIKKLFDVYDKSIDPIQVEVPFTFISMEDSK